MQVNRDKGVIVLNNPRTGGPSVARLMGCAPIDPGAVHLTSKEARASVSAEEWREWTKIVTVRDPVERFRSTCAALGVEPGQALETLEATPVDEWDRVWGHQVRWLAGKLDVVLLTRHIANFANHGQFGRGTVRSNETGAGRAGGTTPGLEERVRALYAVDYAKFEKLRLWHPDPEVVMFVGGECVACRAQRKR